MPLDTGTWVGPYEVVAAIGAGGMGEVYRARDSRLGREVAVKVIPEHLSADEERVRRLEREARAASALNHPNIVTIYDIGRTGREVFVAMELVEGETLRALLTAGSLEGDRVVPIAQQIAAALAVAHDAEIVHRDLKPENVMVRPDGYVKLLDFGLAKLMPRGAQTSAPTAELLTRTGAVMGTRAYMSPEQAAGRRVDHRSDQFSFGLLLYEMLTGERPARSSGEAGGADELGVELDRVDPRGRFRPLLERCLAVDAEARYASSRDLLLEVRTLDAGSGEGSTVDQTDRSAIRSLAVLPLANLSADPEQEFFSDGMTEALITDLAKVRALKVISRTSVMRYRGTEKTLPQIARDLGVDAVVEGSVLRAGERVRITAQLIDAKSDVHLWADSYDRDLRDVLALQSDVARAIAREVEVELSRSEAAELTSRRAVNPESHEAYLRGVYYFNKYSPEYAGRAVELLERAVELDPASAQAHAGLANAYGQQAYWGFSRPAEFVSKSRRAARRAFELDDALAASNAVLGTTEMYLDWDWNRGARHLARALELKPNDSDASLNYGFYLAMMGRYEEAVPVIREARELDPLNLVLAAVLAWMISLSGNPIAAVDECLKALELEVESPLPFLVLWGIHEALDHEREAEQNCERYLELSDKPEVAAAAREGFAEEGYRHAMECAAEALERLAEERYVQSIDIAKQYAHAAVTEKALGYLERAFHESEPRLHLISIDREWDFLRDQPRFVKILESMGLPTELPLRGSLSE